MKRLALASVLVSVGAFGACAVEEPGATDDGGATGGASGVSGASGTPSGGASGTPSGGASGTPSGGASGTPSGGVSGTPSGGVSGTPSGGGGGADPTGGIGGAAPTGGVGGDLLGGMGGTPTTGGMGGTPTTGGMGGGGMAGMLMGGMGGGGKAGGGGSGGGKAGCPSVAELFPTSGNLGSFDGRLVTTPCAPTSSDDCNGGGWVYNGVTTRCMGNLTAQQDFMVGGTPGTTYQVTIHFYGIMEPKNYTGTGITREAGTTRPTNSNTGATPVPWASTTSAGAKSFPLTDYNTYEIHVLDNNMMVNRQYFLNSDTAEGHWTYVINYEKTIPVIGGGRMRVRTYDNNCRMIKNCYDGSQGSFAQCGARARSITAVNNAMPPPGAALVQPGLGQATDQSGQWMYTDVVSVTCQ